MPITHPEKESDFQLTFNKEVFPISKSLFGLYSHTFRNHPYFVFQKSLDMSEKGITNEAFREFVKACQGHFYNINANNCFGLLKLCEKWEVKVVKEEITKYISNIDDASTEILRLQFYLMQGNSEVCKEETKNSHINEKNRINIINDVEYSISKNINFYLSIPSFAELPISSLLRIISKSFSYYKMQSQNQEDNFNSTTNEKASHIDHLANQTIDHHLFLQFLESATNHHKEASRVLIKLIDDYGEFTESELKKLDEIANPFSECDFSEKIKTFLKEIENQNKEIDDFQKELSSIKKKGEKNIKKIEEEVKTLKQSMKKNARNSPSSSKSSSNLAALDNGDVTPESPLNTNPKQPLSNSLSNLNLASKAKVPSESETEGQTAPPAKDKHNLHSKIPIPPSRTQSSPNPDLYLSNSEILESLTEMMNKFNQIKSSNLSAQKSIDFYNKKIAEFQKRCSQINDELIEAKKEAKRKLDEKEKAKAKEEKTKVKVKPDKKKSQSQIEKSQSQVSASDANTKSVSYYIKTDGKITDETVQKSSKHGGKEKEKTKNKDKDKEKTKNNTQESHEANANQTLKANFQTVKETKSKHSLSTIDSDRVSFTPNKEGRKRSSTARATSMMSTTNQQQNQSVSAANADTSSKQQITILINQTNSTNFTGLLHHLINLNASGNLQGIMHIEASSFQTGIYSPDNVTKLSGIWLSEDKENQWILFDFISRKINILDYTIKTIPYGPSSFHMKNWILEGSDNNDKWTLIDKREDNTQLVETSAVADFKAQMCNDQFFRYIRLKMIGPNHSNTNVFALSRIEFYGKLKTSD